MPELHIEMNFTFSEAANRLRLAQVGDQSAFSWSSHVVYLPIIGDEVTFDSDYGAARFVVANRIFHVDSKSGVVAVTLHLDVHAELLGPRPVAET